LLIPTNLIAIFHRSIIPPKQHLSFITDMDSLPLGIAKMLGLTTEGVFSLHGLFIVVQNLLYLALGFDTGLEILTTMGDFTRLPILALGQLCIAFRNEFAL